MARHFTHNEKITNKKFICVMWDIIFYCLSPLGYEYLLHHLQPLQMPNLQYLHQNWFCQ